jgi:ribonuclease HII
MALAKTNPAPKIKSKKETKKVELELPLVDWKKFSPGPVFGVDEVGRGCLAGPVYAAACFLTSDKYVSQMTDSKLMTEAQRNVLSPLIHLEHKVCVGFASVEEIDQINILQASLLAMKRAVLGLEEMLGVKAGHVLIDGSFKIPDLGREQKTIVKGDLRCAPISAASIVAKVARDQLMKDFGVQYPGYGFEKHKGYASSVHRAAIREKGPTEIHRKTFGGVKEYIQLG